MAIVFIFDDRVRVAKVGLDLVLIFDDGVRAAEVGLDLVVVLVLDDRIGAANVADLATACKLACLKLLLFFVLAK